MGFTAFELYAGGQRSDAAMEIVQSCAERLTIVCAALLYDAGILLVPEEIMEKGERLMSPDELR